ncbi:hypothetical protein [Bradyrhizobium mercantei]|uniref:hypothetical protein n=1 Tax=Bradyrhizobium mercantei TaxID=1904807 RepID=UPI00097826AC|nr:hypothetical protein [Bradyrhizobium mercantei]
MLELAFLSWVALGSLIFTLTFLRMIWGALQVGEQWSSLVGGTFILAEYNRKYRVSLFAGFGFAFIGALIYNILFSMGFGQ